MPGDISPAVELLEDVPPGVDRVVSQSGTIAIRGRDGRWRRPHTGQIIPLDAYGWWRPAGDDADARVSPYDEAYRQALEALTASEKVVDQESGSDHLRGLGALLSGLANSLANRVEWEMTVPLSGAGSVTFSVDVDPRLLSDGDRDFILVRAARFANYAMFVKTRDSGE